MTFTFFFSVFILLQKNVGVTTVIQSIFKSYNILKILTVAETFGNTVDLKE